MSASKIEARVKEAEPMVTMLAQYSDDDRKMARVAIRSFMAGYTARGLADATVTEKPEAKTVQA